jgi:hypothetical protein
MGFRNVYWSAFTLTAVAVLFLAAGLSGYNLSRHTRFLVGTSWSGHILWGQVWGGLAAAAGGAFFWRQVIRDANQPRGAETWWAKRTAAINVTIGLSIFALMMWGALRG